MRRNTGGALRRRVAFAVIALLAINPSASAAAGPPASALRPASSSVGTVMVESEPAGAAVYVDSQLTGQTPLKVSGLSAGDHRMRLVKSGYLENARLVSVGATASTVRVRLTRDTGSPPELAAQVVRRPRSAGGGGSKLPLILAVAGGGAAAAIFIVKKRSSDSTNRPPTVGAISFAPAAAMVATNTTFSTVGTSDPDGDTLNFMWDFGDGAVGTGASPTHVYTTEATRTVTVTVSDGRGGSATTTTSVLVLVKSLTGTWTGILNCCGTLNTTVFVNQANTTFTGSFADQNAGDAGTLTSGSVNVTTRVVTLNFAFNGGTGSWSFVGTLDGTASTLTGTTTNFSGVAPPNGSTWTMTRP